MLPCTVEDKEGLLQWTKDDFGLGTKRDLPGYRHDKIIIDLNIYHFHIRYPTYTMRGQDPVRDWSLVIEKVTLEDDGVFQCQVRLCQMCRVRLTMRSMLSILIFIMISETALHKVGSGSKSKAIRSSLAKLTVLVPPGEPRIVHQGFEEGRTELEDVEEEEAVELTCISEGGRPAGEITWRDEDGEQVYRDNPVHFVVIFQ